MPKSLVLAVLGLCALVLGGCASYRDIELGVRMPLEEHPAAGGAGGTFVVLYSGDGGSRGGNRKISQVLAAQGVGVVDVDSLAYFSRRRSVARDAAELEALIEHYALAWHASKVVLAGYSFGGSAVPAIAGALSESAWKRVRSVVLIAPRDYVELTLRPHSWINIKPPHAPPLEADIRALAGARVVCVYGETDGLAACPRLPAGLAEGRKLPGGHKFDGDYGKVAAILEAEAR